MAGWKSGQMIKAIPDVLNLAAAGGTDLALTSKVYWTAIKKFIVKNMGLK